MGHTGNRVRVILARGGLVGSDRRRAVVVVVLLAVVFALRAVVPDPAVGVGLLYVVPAVTAAVWFGPWGGLAVGAAAAGLFALGALIRPQDQLLASTVLRLAIFCSISVAFGLLVRRERHASAELADQEHELAELRALRSALVPPEVPDRPALALATCFVPAQERVSGDFFMVNEGPDNSTVVAVGDVVGKGLKAARRAAFVRAALAAYAPYNDDPCRLLELANAALVERAGASEEFVTATCAVYRPADHSLSWSLAGHPPPMLLDDGRRLNGISPGLPLGLGERVECSRADRALDAGDGFLLFTDGLTEARRGFSEVIATGRARERPRPELFGTDRIAAVLAEHAGEEPGDVVQALRSAAERFTGGSLADDLCMVAVRARN